MSDNKSLLRAALDAQGVTDNELRAGIAALVGGESGWVAHTETPYRNTRNDRIRSIFRSTLGDKPDAFIDDLKSDDARFFEYVYGIERGVGHQLGNTQIGDGFKYRGRGGVQLTGRGNYAKLAELSHLDLIGNPDLVNLPENSAAVTVAYMRWRYHGGGWDAMKRAVGNSFGNVDATKNELFQQYVESGEFNAGAHVAAPRPGKSAVTGAPAADPDDIEVTDEMAARINGAIANFDKAARALQTELKAAQYYDGVIDGDWGPASQAALVDYKTTT